jgi:membrane protease subunit (stomatin/prohibitin family)
MPGMPVSEQNCHPFQWGRYLFMHNGAVGGFMRIRRALLATLSNAAYDTVQVAPACSVRNALSNALGAAQTLNGLAFCAVVSLGLGNMLQHFHAPPAQPDGAADAAVAAAGYGGALLRFCAGAALCLKLTPEYPPPQATINTILAAQKAAGVTETSLLNFVVSDGCAAAVSSRSLAASCPDRHR